MGAARIGDRIYVVGGFRAPSADTTGVLESYDISADTWARLRPLPIGLNHAAVTAAAGRLYVSGGFRARTAGRPRGSIATPRAQSLEAASELPIARAAHAFQAIGGKLYAAGGRDNRTAR